MHGRLSVSLGVEMPQGMSQEETIAFLEKLGCIPRSDNEARLLRDFEVCHPNDKEMHEGRIKEMQPGYDKKRGEL